MTPTLCRSCNAPMIFLRTSPTADRLIPINADTVADGDLLYDAKKHIAHFATCPAAKKWRSKGRKPTSAPHRAAMRKAKTTTAARLL